jgi:hypothetical protein
MRRRTLSLDPGTIIYPPGLSEESPMARLPTYQKNIACLESLWDADIENRLSVRPILKLASMMNNVKFTYLTCNTREEMKHNLEKLKGLRGYGILYLAFHGKPGVLLLDESSVDLETLAAFMGRGFVDWVVHFGSCSTIDVERYRIRNFMNATGVSMVLGYKKDVDWIESTVTDLLFLDWLQSYKNMKSLWKRFRERYRELVARTGLMAFHR